MTKSLIEGQKCPNTQYNKNPTSRCIVSKLLNDFKDNCLITRCFQSLVFLSQLRLFLSFIWVLCFCAMKYQKKIRDVGREKYQSSKDHKINSIVIWQLSKSKILLGMQELSHAKIWQVKFNLGHCSRGLETKSYGIWEV